MPNDRSISILSETPIEQIWSYLSLWESETAARRLIDEKSALQQIAVDENRFAEKARGVAYCLRNARECLRLREEAWIPRIVSKYYGTMWLLSAVMISDPASPYTLQELEGITKKGHGLSNVVDENAAFPASEFVYVRDAGFFPAFLKSKGWSKKQLAEARPTNQRIEDVATLTPEDWARLISLDDLFRRIPELAAYYTEVTGRRSMTAHVFHCARNMMEQAERNGAEMKKGNFQPSPNPGYTWIGIAGSKGMSEVEVKALGLPLTEWELGSEDAETYWRGKFEHDPASFWHQALPLHQSAMAPTSWIAPVSGSSMDYLATNFMLLYGLSILTRYRPRTWREVVEGQFDTFRPLVSLYLQVVDRVLPEIALEQVSGRRVSAVQPGSLFAPA